MLRIIFTIIICYLPLSSICSQVYYEVGDSLELKLDGYKYGNIKWQFAADTTKWYDIFNSSDTLFKAKVDSTIFYRAFIKQCNDVSFSELYKVEVPRSDVEFANFIGSYLSSDELTGRKPGTLGDSLSVNFISDVFKRQNLSFLNSNSYIKPFLTTSGTTTSNVIGVLPGKDPMLKKEFIVVSGHYDHLGTSNGKVFNGADDNASGVAGVCVLARSLKDIGLKRSLVFITPGVEETGQQGTMAFLKSKEIPIESIKYVLNFDMIGRLRNDSVFFCSTKVQENVIPKILSQNNDNLNIKFLNSGLFAGSTSDNGIYTALQGKNALTSFGITTGKHSDYHKYTDDWDKINTSGLIKITNLVYRIILNLANE